MFQFPANPTLGPLLALLAGCSTLHVEGECTYTREVKTHYQCEPGSAIEHTRVLPGPPSQ